MKLVIVSILLLSLISIIKCNKLTKSTELVQSLPEKERLLFLAYTLGQGYMQQHGSIWKKYPFPILQRIPEELEKKFQTLEKPKYFTRNLYEFVRNKYDLSSFQLYKLCLSKKICFSRKKCIDLENIGELCCPF